MINLQKKDTKKWYTFEILRYLDVIDAYDGNCYFRNYHKLGKAKAEFVRMYALYNGNCSDYEVQQYKSIIDSCLLSVVFAAYISTQDYFKTCLDVRTKREWQFTNFWYRFNFKRIRLVDIIDIYNEVRSIVKAL